MLLLVQEVFGIALVSQESTRVVHEAITFSSCNSIANICTCCRGGLSKSDPTADIACLTRDRYIIARIITSLCRRRIVRDCFLGLHQAKCGEAKNQNTIHLRPIAFGSSKGGLK